MLHDSDWSAGVGCPCTFSAGGYPTNMNNVTGLFSGDSIDFGVWSCGPKPVGLYVTSSTTLSLSFYICKTGIGIPTFSKRLLGQSMSSVMLKNLRKLAEYLCIIQWS